MNNKSILLLDYISMRYALRLEPSNSRINKNPELLMCWDFNLPNCIYDLIISH